MSVLLAKVAMTLYHINDHFVFFSFIVYLQSKQLYHLGPFTLVFVFLGLSQFVGTSVISTM